MLKEESKVLAVDLGFGWTKGIYGDIIFRQPSVLGEPRPLHDGDLRVDDIVYDGNRLFVGNLALRHSDIRYYTINDNRTDNWIANILLKCALVSLSPGLSPTLITGLPLDFYFKQKVQMETFLDGFISPQRVRLSVGGNYIEDKISIKNYKIVPQPLGSGMNYLLDDDGNVRDPEEAKQIIIVADVGFHTFDLLVLDNMEIHRYSHSDTEISIANTYKMIQQAIRVQKGRAPDIYQLDMFMLRGTYEGLDLSNHVSKAFTALANQVEFAINSLNINYHKLILTGGWSVQIADLLNKRDKLVVFDQDGNINGYEKIGRRVNQNVNNTST